MGVKIGKLSFWISLFAFLIIWSFIVLAADSYIIVHAVNPEGVEIGSIALVGGVGIYDGDALIGYGARNNETHNKPIAISPGTHIIKAKFNGMTKEQTISLTGGETRVLTFTFIRTEFDLSGLVNIIMSNPSNPPFRNWIEIPMYDSFDSWYSQSYQTFQAPHGGVSIGAYYTPNDIIYYNGFNLILSLGEYPPVYDLELGYPNLYRNIILVVMSNLGGNGMIYSLILKLSSVPYDLTGTGIKCEAVKPPVASFTYYPQNPKIDENINFDASSSHDPDGTVVEYEWDFGDGNTTEGMQVIHAYNETGNYTVTLTVTDNEGLQNSLSKVVQVKEKKLKLLIIPINWQGGYSSFKTKAQQISQYYLERIPLKDCPEEFEALISEQEDYGYGWNGWSCYDSGIVNPKCDDRHTLQKIAICAAQYKASTGKDYDYVAGITDRDTCGGIGGWSDGQGGLPVIIAESSVPGVVTHELGHEFSLADEYCDCSGTPYASYCGPTAPINPLKTELGCDTSTCCWDYGNGPYNSACGWCHGNYDRMWAGGIGQRSTMSNKILSGETGHYDVNGYAHLKTIPELRCDSSEVLTLSLMSTTTNNNPHSVYSDSLLTISLIAFNNDTVEAGEIDVGFGYTPIVYPKEGDYSLRVLDINNNSLYSRNMSLDFILFSDPPEIVNYSYIYDKIPFNNSMDKLELYHSNNLIFSQKLDFCNYNNSCDENENYYSCPSDCLPYEEDGICNKAKDNGCDLDCLLGIDPDCSIHLNTGWNLISIPLFLENNSVNYLFNKTNITIYSYKNNSWFVPKEIDNKLGYWVKINKTRNITLSGTEIKDKTINLTKDWNLVSYPYLNEISVNESELKDYTTFTYINNSWSSYIPNRTFNSLQTLKPGFGYLVKNS